MSTRHHAPSIRRHGVRGALALGCITVLGCLCAAPTPGDIGGCQPARELDEDAFFSAKHNVDCQRCGECGIHTDACARACAGQRDVHEHFPEHCVPLAHDGAVCLRALQYAACSEYRRFVADDSATLPTECDFCALDERPGDGGSR